MLKNLPLYLANARKAVINITGLLAALLTLGLLHDPWSAYVSTAVAVGTAIAHYVVPNAPAPGEVAAVEQPPSDEELENPADEWLPADVKSSGQLHIDTQTGKIS